RTSPKEAVTEVEDDVVAHHLGEAHIGRLVEAVHALNFFDEAGIETAPAAIVAQLTGPLLTLRRRHFGALARNACRAWDVATLEPRNHLLDWTARRRLNDDEIEQHDPEDCRDDQKKAPNDISEHRAWPPRLKRPTAL